MIVLEAGEEVRVDCPTCHGTGHGMWYSCHLCEDGVVTACLAEDLEVDDEWVQENILEGLR